MPGNFYTFLIIPKKKKSVKKIHFSGSILKYIAVFATAFVFLSAYLLYDYLHIKVDEFELLQLKQETKQQQANLDALLVKVNDFSRKMEELRIFDKKIRTMANVTDEQGKGKMQTGMGGSIDVSQSDYAVSDQEAIVDHIQNKIKQLTQEAFIQEKSFNELFYLLREKKYLLASTPSAWPVEGYVSSDFGYRISPFGKGREFHGGLDIAADRGEEVLAPADGVVAEVFHRTDIGNTVKVEHGHGFCTFYGHLDKIIVVPGHPVKRGSVIGYVGSSGRSTGPHLHYTVLFNGLAVDPRKYLN